MVLVLTGCVAARKIWNGNRKVIMKEITEKMNNFC